MTLRRGLCLLLVILFVALGAPLGWQVYRHCSYFALRRNIADRIYSLDRDRPANISPENWEEAADAFVLKKQWPSVKAIGMAVRVTDKSDGTRSEDVRYFIASRYLSGKRFAQSVRGHWAIENSLHRVLDVTFNEDQSRACERRLADNLSWLRRFGISLLKQHPSKDGLKARAKSPAGATTS